MLIRFKTLALALSLCLIAIITACKKDVIDDVPPTVAAPIKYQQADQMGRPAINTVFVTDATDKNTFNTTIPSQMSAAFMAKFKTRLLALNAGYTTNALGQSADAITGLLSADVLNVKTVGTTTFFDGVNVLTGRTLANDVIDVELLLLFGGPTGASNPTLTSDNVGSNDKAFLNTFPYLATPH